MAVRMPGSPQTPSAVLMVRPSQFSPNPETAADNVFQAPRTTQSERVATRARREVDEVARILSAAGVHIHLFDERLEDATPDCVFPNNWISTHPSGEIVLYPMYAPSRRRERRNDVVEMLKREYRVTDVLDYSVFEAQGLYLEGTGAMIIDHGDATVYLARSRRANEALFHRVCAELGYEPFVFDTVLRGRPIYHTNVMMSIGTDFALVGLELVEGEDRRAQLRSRLQEGGRTVIALTATQVENFAANCMALASPQGPILAISARGLQSLEAGQVRTIEQFAKTVSVPVPTIELAGGSVRCMLAGIHLKARPKEPRAILQAPEG